MTRKRSGGCLRLAECKVCLKNFTTRRAHARYCSARCRQTISRWLRKEKGVSQ